VKTALTDKLLIRHPIIQAPIGTCGGPELAGAVSNAGALGSMAIWAYAPDIAARLVGELAALTSRPFSVNIRADLNQHEHTRVALDAGARGYLIKDHADQILEGIQHVLDGEIYVSQEVDSY